MEKILIVEDEVIIALDISQKLASLNYHVTDTACSPEEALESIARQRPDIILMDINLKSKEDGIELAAKINESNRIPVIYMTSYSDMATIERAVSTEPYGYIIKPYTVSILASTLKTAFTRLDLERQTAEHNQMLSTLIDSMSNAVAIVTQDGILEKANRYFFRLFDVEGADLNELQPYFADVIDIHMLNTLKDEGTQEIIKADVKGTTKSLLITASIFVWENGSRILLNITDLTEMYAIKYALSEAEKRFSKIFRKKMVPAALIRCKDLQIYEINEAFMALYKLDDDSYANKNLALYTGEETAASIKEFADNGTPLKVDRAIQKTAGGKEFFADFRGKQVTLDDTEYLLIDIYDVTDQVQMEHTEKEMQQKLIHANKMTSLGTLVSGVAHEINNPNNFIMFNSSLLIEFWDSIFKAITDHSNIKEIEGMTLEELRSDIIKLTDGIVNGSQRIKSIVQDLKGFAKNEANDAFEPVSISDVCMTAIRILDHQINKSTENFIVNIEENTPPVNANKQKLEQVLINIIMNALEAITSRNNLVEVKCFTSENSCVLEVIDEGIGIPAEHIDRITDPFFTTRQGEGGTGLGLSIAYSIIQEHKGSLEITSEENKGTTVRIILPGSDNGRA